MEYTAIKVSSGVDAGHCEVEFLYFVEGLSDLVEEAPMIKALFDDLEEAVAEVLKRHGFEPVRLGIMAQPYDPCP